MEAPSNRLNSRLRFTANILACAHDPFAFLHQISLLLSCAAGRIDEIVADRDDKVHAVTSAANARIEEAEQFMASASATIDDLLARLEAVRNDTSRQDFEAIEARLLEQASRLDVLETENSHLRNALENLRHETAVALQKQNRDDVVRELRQQVSALYLEISAREREGNEWRAQLTRVRAQTRERGVASMTRWRVAKLKRRIFCGWLVGIEREKLSRLLEHFGPDGQG